MKKSLNKFIKGYMEVLYALSSVFYIGFCFCVLVQVISRNFLHLHGGLRRWSGCFEA